MKKNLLPTGSSLFFPDREDAASIYFKKMIGTENKKLKQSNILTYSMYHQKKSKPTVHSRRKKVHLGSTAGRQINSLMTAPEEQKDSNKILMKQSRTASSWEALAPFLPSPIMFCYTFVLPRHLYYTLSYALMPYHTRCVSFHYDRIIKKNNLLY